ncbi:MAG: VOC family protein [Comamonadaceae bacterium]|nr:MAG: VOC family protein [Comamonadaceae bacterium]
MPRITHIALKVNELEKESRLLEEVFGFKYASTVQSVGHVSRHLTDGRVFLTLMKYESEASPEALLAGPGTCIHHIGFEVDDPAAYDQAIRDFGCEILGGSPTKLPVKFRTPDGIVAELLASDTIPVEKGASA